MGLLRGVAAAGGWAAGPIHIVEESPPALPAGFMDRPLEAFRGAAERASDQLERLAARTRGRNPQGADVLDAQAMMLRDPAIEEAVEQALAAGASLEDGITGAFDAYAQQIAALGDEYLGARADDVREAARLLLRALSGAPPGALAALPGACVVVARELSPADTLSADPALLLGVVTETGGRTSHAAIVARELGIPAVVGCGNATTVLHSGDRIRVDGTHGTVEILDRSDPG
jgi:phosphoenolpyruvate-protein phosphotransferase (PTS system enzyme I)